MADAHLSTAELLRWRDDGAGDRARIVAHLASCPACRQTAAELERERPAEGEPERFDPRDFAAAGYGAGPRRAVARRRLAWMATAAALVLAAVWVPLMLRDRSDSALRGGAAPVTLVRPVDAKVARKDVAFEWRVTSGVEVVRLTVTTLDGAAAPLLERDVSGTRYVPTDEERARLRPGQTIHWFVDYREAGGATGTSPAARFTLVP
jgi:hypothetical protein